MRTVSGSRRWLVYCEVPGRRRSTSACKSASARGKPGGHPSTTQPSAGPWLSPKLVTVNMRPNEFPATRWFSLSQIPGPQQKYPAAAHGNVRPNERQPWKGAQQRVFGIADFHDQNAVRTAVPPCPCKDRPPRTEAIAARGKPDFRLVLVLARQLQHLRAPDIGRI